MEWERELARMLPKPYPLGKQRKLPFHKVSSSQDVFGGVGDGHSVPISVITISI